MFLKTSSAIEMGLGSKVFKMKLSKDKINNVVFSNFILFLEDLNSIIDLKNVSYIIFEIL